MQQPSIFEPLFPARQLAHSYNMHQLNMPIWQAAAPEHEAFMISHAASAAASAAMQLHPQNEPSWFNTATPPPPPISCPHGILRRASSSSLINPTITDHAPILADSIINSTQQTKVMTSSSAPRKSTMISENELSSSFDIKACKAAGDDGSVASKLLCSITKSISSPSLQLPSSKEAVRETSFQKFLKLKQLKLQHCAEALGMESSDSSLLACDNIMSECSRHAEKPDMIDTFFSSSPQPSKAQIQDSSLITSVQSAPNLNALPKTNMTSQYSKYTRCTSFPPPLSHTLPSSPSCDSLSPSLRAYRQDGRFILKEVMVPSKNYFHANRRDGRLTLHIFTREDEDEENLGSPYDHQQGPTFKLDSESHERTGFDAVEEQDKGVVFLTRATLEDDWDGDELISTDRIHVLAEDVGEKTSVTSAEFVKGDFTEMPVAAAAACKAASPEAMQCIATCRHRNDIDGVAVRNLPSIERAQHVVAQYGDRIESNPGSPLVWGPMKQSTIMHPPGYKSHGLSSTHHDMSPFSQSKENFIWESNLRPCASVQYRGHGGDERRSVLPSRGTGASALVKSVMRMVTELATVGASYDGRDWCTLAKGRKALVVAGDMSTVVEQDRDHNISEALMHSDQDSTASCSLEDAYSALTSVLMGGGITGIDEEYIVSCGGSGMISAHPRSGYNHHDKKDIKVSHNIELAHGTEVSTFSYPHSASALPPPLSGNAANFGSQSDEWLHSLHSCKELSDYRNQFNMTCFMKPHCIATRS